jgi:ubiquinone/menaquinone biosynthesis C-methylase UbiE
VLYPTQDKKFKLFEESYLSTRKKEGRVMNDEMVSLLPMLPQNHPLQKEWKLRAFTAERFNKYLRSKQLGGPVLDLGCGNGWFTNYISTTQAIANVYGMDINRYELEQAARVFQNTRVKFLYGDIFEGFFKRNAFALIVLNSSIQYFPNARPLLERLFELLQPGGEIHLLDSPFYPSPSTRAEAQKRTVKYFKEMGSEEMATFYHHHSFTDLKGFSYELMYDPNRWGFRLSKLFGRHISPFPWIRISR